jgi:CubicO group peptidase (beta-lactamase class C family)
MCLKTSRRTLKAGLTFFSIIILLGTISAQTDAVNTFLKGQMKELRIPGMQVAVVRHGKIVLNKSYGIANLQDSVPVNNKSIFAINSCTKAFTGVAIMQLVEEGKIELSAPVSQYLDGLPSDWQQVTIKQLLTHISGLPDILWLFNPVTHGIGEWGTEAAVWEKIKTMPMDCPTGEQFRYNQTNYVLLGKIIDKLTGKPFAQVFKERQFEMAGMPNTVFGDSRDIIPHFAPTYNLKPGIDRPNEIKLTSNYSEFPAFQRTGSGLNSTAEDMAKWIIALQQGKLLKTKTALDTLWTASRYNNGSPTQWALGWGLTKFRPKHRAVGMSGGGRSAFLVYPDDDLAVIILTNLGGSSPENFIEELAGYYNPDIPASDPVTILRIQLKKRGFDKAMEIVDEQKKKDASFQPSENDLNEWAYRMMRNEQNKEALEIFKLNTLLYPESWNVYDSYGEVFLKIGQKEEAIKMYRKSIELNPKNEGGKKVLEKILKELSSKTE